MLYGALPSEVPFCMERMMIMKKKLIIVLGIVSTLLCLFRIAASCKGKIMQKTENEVDDYFGNWDPTDE